MATHKTTRRTALAATAAASLSTLMPATSVAQELGGEPTRRGRKLLDLIAAVRSAWRTVPDEETSPEGFGRHEEWVGYLFTQQIAVAGDILAQPVRTVHDLADRAVLLGWIARKQDPGWIDNHIEGAVDRLTQSLLTPAGVTLAECDEDPHAVYA